MNSNNNIPNPDSGNSAAWVQILSYIIYAIVNKQPSNQDHTYSNTDPLVRYTRRLITATIFIAGAAFLSFGAAILQWSALSGQQKIMQGQLDEAKSQRLVTIAQLRATLRPERPELTPYGEAGKRVGVGEKILGWDVSPVWTNVGPTEAQDFVAWWDIFIRPIRYNADKTIDADCPPLESPGKIAPTVLPHDGTAPMLSKKLSIEDAIKAGGENPAVLTHIHSHAEYKDVFSPS